MSVFPSYLKKSWDFWAPVYLQLKYVANETCLNPLTEPTISMWQENEWKMEIRFVWDIIKFYIRDIKIKCIIT